MGEEHSTPLSQSNFFHFHAVLAKIVPNSFSPQTQEWAPTLPPSENPGSAAVCVYNGLEMLKTFGSP